MDRKVILLLMLGAVFFYTACEGDSLYYPDAGEEYPGGTMDVYFDDFAAPTVNAIIAFDPDSTVVNGNEIFVELSLEPYYEEDQQQNGTIQAAFNWYTTDVEPGSYYVYAWLDLDANGTLTPGDEENTIQIYSENNGLYYNGIGEELQTEVGINIPNYTFWDDFAAELHFLLYEPLRQLP